jgi:hypothetical protein
MNLKDSRCAKCGQFFLRLGLDAACMLLLPRMYGEAHLRAASDLVDLNHKIDDGNPEDSLTAWRSHPNTDAMPFSFPARDQTCRTRRTRSYHECVSF